jgi:RNA polymerase sigma-70 factor (ECF subfamily)
MSSGLNYGLTGSLLRLRAFPGLANLSDEELMERLQEGNHNALTVLFNRYHRMVLSIGLHILRDSGEAEDLMQCVFFEIFRSAGQFDPSRGTVKTWILQCAYNLGFNRRRYLSLRGIYSENNHPDFRQKYCTYSGRSLGPVELAQVAREALRQLSRGQRVILEFAFYDGFTMREIAEKTGKTFDSVRHDYYRALKKLKCILTYTPSESKWILNSGVDSQSG